MQAIWPNREYGNFRLHCFADRAPAELFQSRAGGEFSDPQRDRENGRVRAHGGGRSLDSPSGERPIKGTTIVARLRADDAPQREAQ